jgi:hypothetical protein
VYSQHQTRLAALHSEGLHDDELQLQLVMTGCGAPSVGERAPEAALILLLLYKVDIIVIECLKMVQIESIECIVYTDARHPLS